MQVLIVIFDLVWLLSVLGFLGFIAIGGGRYLNKLSRSLEAAVRANYDSINRLSATVERLLDERSRQASNSNPVVPNERDK